MSWDNARIAPFLFGQPLRLFSREAIVVVLQLSQRCEGRFPFLLQGPCNQTIFRFNGLILSFCPRGVVTGTLQSLSPVFFKTFPLAGAVLNRLEVQRE